MNDQELMSKRVTWSKVMEILGCERSYISRSKILREGIDSDGITIALLDAEVTRKVRNAEELTDKAVGAHERFTAYIVEVIEQ